MTDLKAWICSNCKQPVELHEDDVGELLIFCPGDDPTCSSWEDRWLTDPDQIEAIPVERVRPPTDQQIEELKEVLPNPRADYLP